MTFGPRIGEYYNSIPTLSQFKTKISKSKFKVYTKHTLNITKGILEIPKEVNLTFEIKKVFERDGFVYFNGIMSDFFRDYVDEFRLVYMGPGFFVVHSTDNFYTFKEYNFEVSYE